MDILTEYWVLNRHLLILKKRELSNYNLCGLEETDEHFVASCERYSIVRYELLFEDFLNVEKLHEMIFLNLLRDVKKSDRFGKR